MNVSISYKHVDSQEAVALEVTRRLDKLGRLLKSYEPDLVQIKGVFSKKSTDRRAVSSADAFAADRNLARNGQREKCLGGLQEGVQRN